MLFMCHDYVSKLKELAVDFWFETGREQQFPE